MGEMSCAHVRGRLVSTLRKSCILGGSYQTPVLSSSMCGWSPRLKAVRLTCLCSHAPGTRDLSKRARRIQSRLLLAWCKRQVPDATLDLPRKLRHLSELRSCVPRPLSNFAILQFQAISSKEVLECGWKATNHNNAECRCRSARRCRTFIGQV